jgi:pimeloyl-ACP methyl ester carboxylesterase
VQIVERHTEVAGLETHWRQAGEVPILYVHGVPTASWDWEPFLARTGGVAPDLPGFGNSAKPGDFDYSIPGYDRFLEAFCDHARLERFSLVVNDWGGVALALAQRFPERIERLVLFSTVPLLPGFKWHRVARAWRTPLVGELTMGFTTRWAMRRSLPRVIADRAYTHFDQGTQRAILRLYRSAPGRVALSRADPLAQRRSLHLRRVRPPLRGGPRRGGPARIDRRRALELDRAARAGGAGGGLSGLVLRAFHTRAGAFLG